MHTCTHMGILRYIHTYTHTYTHAAGNKHGGVAAASDNRGIARNHTCMHAYTHTHTHMHTYIYIHKYPHTAGNKHGGVASDNRGTAQKGRNEHRQRLSSNMQQKHTCIRIYIHSYIHTCSWKQTWRGSCSSLRQQRNSTKRQK